jgi:hypothetical protein
MNVKRLAMVIVPGVGLVVLLLWALGARSDPVRAGMSEGVTPVAPTGGISAPDAAVDEAHWHRDSRPGRSLDGRGRVRSATGALSSGGVANGDFENGRDGSWEEFSFWGYDIITNALPVAAHSGTWAAWLGGDNYELSYISQTVAISAEASSLGFWNWIASDDLCGYDYAWVLVDDTEVFTISLCDDNNTYGWVTTTVDLSAYAGQTVTLQIEVSNDFSLVSHLLVDDVALEGGSGGGSYAYLPLVLQNSCGGYYDGFSNPSSGWLVGDWADLTCGYLDGEYRARVKTDTWMAYLFRAPNLSLPDNYRIEVDARQTSANPIAYGLMFGISGGGGSPDGYQFLVYPDIQAYHLWKRTGGDWFEVVGLTASSAIKADTETNHIRVDRIGTKIYLYVNGTRVNTVTDGSLVGPGLGAGLRVLSLEDVPAEARFDNYSVCFP